MTVLATALVLSACCALPGVGGTHGTPGIPGTAETAAPAADSHGVPAVADPANLPPWLAAVVYERTDLDGVAEPWHTLAAAVTRRWARGALQVSVRHVDRVVATDVGAGVDAYFPTWRGGYANLRLQLAPDADIIPTAGAALELFQVLAPEWEASALVREDRYPDARVTTVGGSLAHFTGSWSVRARANASTVGGEWAGFGSGHLRRTFGDRDSFIEIAGGGGREVVEIVLPGDPGQVHPDIRRAATGALATQLLATRHVGARFGLGYSHYDGLADRVHATAGILYRW